MKKRILYGVLAGALFWTTSSAEWSREGDIRALMSELRDERQQLREELRILRQRYPDGGDAFLEALNEWLKRRDDLVAEWSFRAERIAGAEPVSPGFGERSLPEGVDEAALLRFELREEMRAVREAHANRSPDERAEAILSWRLANEHRFEEVRRRAEQRAAAERSREPEVFVRDYSHLPPETRVVREAREALRAERRELAARFGPGQEEERQEALIHWMEANRERLEALRLQLERALSEEEEA